MTPLKVRRASGPDMSAVGRLGAMLVKAHHDFDSKRFIPPRENTPQGYAAFLGDQLSNAKVIVMVAEVDERIVGYTYAGVEGYDWMSLRGPAGVLYEILIDPDYRKHGIGKALLDATVDALKSAGADQVLLSTAVQNEDAQRLFERAGFRRTMIEMTKEL